MASIVVGSIIDIYKYFSQIFLIKLDKHEAYSSPDTSSAQLQQFSMCQIIQDFIDFIDVVNL